MTAVTIRYQILRALQCAGQPLASTEIASLTGVPLLRVKAHLTELHRREKVYRVAGFRWACAGSAAPAYISIRARVLSALVAAGRPVRGTWIAQHADCPVDRVHTCLSELRARGEAVRVRPSRWALAGVVAEPDDVDRRARQLEAANDAGAHAVRAARPVGPHAVERTGQREGPPATTLYAANAVDDDVRRILHGTRGQRELVAHVVDSDHRG